MEIYTYLIDLPDGFNEAVLPCADGYTVYINARLCGCAQKRAYRHALWHIKNDDWEKYDVNEIERLAHEVT